MVENIGYHANDDPAIINDGTTTVAETLALGGRVLERKVTNTWFSVRCVFLHEEGVYEERITLWHVDSFDTAIAEAEVDAAAYVEGLDSRYLGLAQAYGPLDDTPGHGVEVFSLIRASGLGPEEYLAALFDTGGEAQQGWVPPNQT